MTATLDILVCGLPRSGTTLMCDLLTDPIHARRCENEPQSDQLDGWRNIDGRPYLLKKWAIKQVRGPLINQSIQMCRPNQIVVIARDIRHVVLSHLEYPKAVKSPMRPSTPDFVRNQIKDWLPMEARNLVEVAMKHDVIVVQYEELLTERGRDEVGTRIDWPLTGLPALRHERTFEWTRHGGPFVTNNSVELRQHQLDTMDDSTAEFIADIEQACISYTSAFGMTAA